MDRLKIERLGGFAGFGGPGSRLKSQADLVIGDLSHAERTAVDALFDAKAKVGASMPDAFRYRLTRQTAGGPQTVEVAEQQVPAGLRNSVRDTLD